MTLSAGLSTYVCAQDVPLVIEHVAVIDVIAGRVQPDMTIEIRGRRIAAVSDGRHVRVPAGAILIEGRGRYLIPGLWDMHVHVSFPPGAAQIFLPLMVANGVLGARDMHSLLSIVVPLKHAVASGSQIGPRLFVAGPAVDGPHSYLPAAQVVRTSDEAREAVRQLKAGGVDFIKVYSSLPRELYFAVDSEAKRVGLPFVGHVPYPVTAAEASDAGQRSMEHLTEVDVGTSSEEGKIKSEEVEAMDQRRGSIPDVNRLRATYDSGRAAALFERFRRNDTWQVPTLVVLHNAGQSARGGRRTDDSLLTYIPKALREYWASLPPDVAAHMGALDSIHAALVGPMNRAGVPLLAGTDCPNPYVYPGFSLHDELGLLVRAGLTPAEALRTATINPARFLGVTDSLGSVATGKVADLVLLEANPLDDIANTKRIRAVIRGGRLLDRAALNQLLARAETLAAN
ncbi:MAG TPA: amidohydrolase family protein [Gemmatimonadales bacterium]|nr:amidohydrolase family protein [Gemmatimonadales bacterium]